MKKVTYAFGISILLVLTSTGCEKYNDNSEWKPVSNGIFGGGITDIATDPVTNYIYASSNGRVFLSKNNCQKR